MSQNIRPVVDKLMYTSYGQIVLSSLFGLALALLFRRVCKDNCTIYYAPYTDEVTGHVFKLEDTCYTYAPYMVKCDDKNTLNPYDVNIRPDNKISYTVLSSLTG